MNELKTVFAAIKYAVFPKRCCFCGKVIPPHEDECGECEAQVPRVSMPICYRCGEGKDRCNCKKNRNRFVTAFASPFYYSGLVKKSIMRLKLGDEKDIAKALGKEMADFSKMVYDGVKFDFVTYIPMTHKEFTERGYNQVELIASEIAKELSIECKCVLTKLYETSPQRMLNERYRSGNVFGAFDVNDREAVKDKRILLCDDVLTTGNTLSECAKMLMIHGAREVMCLTAAVGMSRKKRR